MQEITLSLVFIPLLLLLGFLITRRGGGGRQLPPSPTALPIIGHFHLLGPILHREFRQLAERHGPLISLRLGSVPFVVATSKELAREILKTSEVCFTSRLNTVASDRLTYASAMAFAPYESYWKFIRRLVMEELLGSRPVSTFSSLRLHEFRCFLSRLAHTTHALNLTQELMKLSNGIITKMVLGSDGMDDARVEEARVVVRDVAIIFGELNLSDFVWFLKKVDVQGFGKRIDSIYKRFDSLLETVIGEREDLRKKKKLSGENKDHVAKDFLDILLDHLEDSKDENVEFTRLHLKGLIVDLFSAGTDTTAVSTEWALAELINHPMVLEKAKEEIERVVGQNRLVNESDIPNLPYLQSVMKEVLRLHPAVPLVMRQCVKECQVDKYTIPKDAVVVVNSWAIARDPNYWENPLEFRPERFLETKGLQMDVKGQQFELLPFGSGRRICPGMNMALQTVPTLVALIIQCFDLKIVDSVKNKDGLVLSMDEGPGITAPRLHNLVCVPVPRFASLTSILES